MMDSEFYNQWLDDIRSEYPFIKLQLMSSVDAKVIDALYYVTSYIYTTALYNFI